MANDDHRDDCYGLSVDRLLRVRKSVRAGIPALTDPLVRICYNSKYLSLPVVAARHTRPLPEQLRLRLLGSLAKQVALALEVERLEKTVLNTKIAPET